MIDFSFLYLYNEIVQKCRTSIIYHVQIEPIREC